ncbi:hypothetical protein CFC21_052774 [Triticum aestivum]|uniref:FAF domain-containing protein n=3 Tax=Triticum TaxID=4564 RepID=A0A9R0VZG2_TRITD|nr:protein FANTASTIC FOUR 3-like [Triticum aestivum]KAF7043413.1 hypothetical protein CFC21_052774 [Triticum aestivum]VAH93009.1 unnamed protein product [Triticum turgidum subsp. durum]
MAHMATAVGDGALRRLFEKPLPENPTLLEVLSACNNHSHHKKQLPAVDPASFTEIFGELHFYGKPDGGAARPVLPRVPLPDARATAASWLDIASQAEKSNDDSSLDALLRPKPASAGDAAGGVRRSASFCLKKSSASLLLCTEGLGSESTVDSDDMVRDDGADAAAALRGREREEATLRDAAAAAESGLVGSPPSFPPPIRSIGRGGKPCVCFRTFRADGRFVLTQVVIPGKELLQASREGGRLRLRFANPAAADEELELGDQEDDREDNMTCIDACA